jgi:hypothetical protein
MADVALSGVIYIAFLCVCAIKIHYSQPLAHFKRHFSEISISRVAICRLDDITAHFPKLISALFLFWVAFLELSKRKADIKLILECAKIVFYVFS